MPGVLRAALLVCAAAVAVEGAIEYKQAKVLMELTADNFDRIVHDNARHALIAFYTHWCEKSQLYMPHLNSLAVYYARERRDDILVAAVDCDAQPALCKERFEVPGYPYLMYFTPHTPAEGAPYQKFQFSVGERKVYRGKTYNVLREFGAENLEPQCHIDELDPCTARQREYIAKWGGKSDTEIRKQVARINNMKGTLTLDNRRWNAQRLRLLLEMVEPLTELPEAEAQPADEEL